MCAGVGVSVCVLVYMCSQHFAYSVLGLCTLKRLSGSLNAAPTVCCRFAHKYLDVKLFPRDYQFDPDHVSATCLDTVVV